MLWLIFDSRCYHQKCQDILEDESNIVVGTTGFTDFALKKLFVLTESITMQFVMLPI